MCQAGSHTCVYRKGHARGGLSIEVLGRMHAQRRLDLRVRPPQADRHCPTDRQPPPPLSRGLIGLVRESSPCSRRGMRQSASLVLGRRRERRREMDAGGGREGGEGGGIQSVGHVSDHGLPSSVISPSPICAESASHQSPTLLESSCHQPPSADTRPTVV